MFHPHDKISGGAHYLEVIAAHGQGAGGGRLYASGADIGLYWGMERYSKGRLKLLEEGLQTQIAEFKTDFSDKDIHAAAKLGRSVRNNFLLILTATMKEIR